MTVYGTPISEIPFTTWWMLLSFAAAIGGFGGNYILKILFGAQAIIREGEMDPKFSRLRVMVAPNSMFTNRVFERVMNRRALSTPLGNFFFWLMITGIVTNIAFWIYAANFMKDAQ